MDRGGVRSAEGSRGSEPPVDSSNEDFLFHLYRGSELLQDNRIHEAKEELERALRLQPRDAKGQDLIAVVYFRLKLYGRAIYVYEQLRRRNADDPALLLNLALCYLKTAQPALARRELEHLLSLNPGHTRAWGYLGLACERMGDLEQAERAFRQGGHLPMAKRIAERRAAASADAPYRSEEVRGVADAAFQELDAGELSFALAEPTLHEDAAVEGWHAHEIGQADRTAERRETLKPDTRDGPTADPSDRAPLFSIPHLAHRGPSNRRPTLLAPAGAPPMEGEYSALERFPASGRLPLEGEALAVLAETEARVPVVSVPSPYGATEWVAPEPDPTRTRTLMPPEPESQPEAPRPEAPLVAAPAAGPAPKSPLEVGPTVMSAGLRAPRAPAGAPASPGDGEPSSAIPAQPVARALRFPTNGVLLHRSGVALVHVTPEAGFAARLEAVRAQQSGLSFSVLERRTKAPSGAGAFGGVTSPMVLASGEGQLVLAARPGRKLKALATGGESYFVREDVLLGFGAALSYEHGRLTTDEDEHVPVVQLRGEGAVLLEALGEVLALHVSAERSISVRHEVIVGWFGRLVPRALSPNDAPCGQRGLVSFSGEGRVLFAST